MDRVNGRPCYCSIGAGGTPCIDRKYCNALREIERLNKIYEISLADRTRMHTENKKLREEAAQIMRTQLATIDDYSDLTAKLQEQCDKYMGNALDAWERVKRLRAALERIANAYKHDSIAGDIAREALRDAENSEDNLRESCGEYAPNGMAYDD